MENGEKEKLAMKRSKIFSALLAFVFVASSAMAQPSVYQFDIPDKIGKVKERYAGKTDSVVIHIQDAHKSSEAQKNIANIVEYLSKKDDLRLVAEEGHSIGKIDVSHLRKPIVPELHRSAIESLVQQGYLTGGEYAAAIASEEVAFEGLEDRPTLEKNLKAFYVVNANQEKALAELSVLKEAAISLETDIFNADLNTFRTSLESYENDETDFVDYSVSLINKAKELKIDLFSYLHLSQYTEYLAEKDALDVEAVQTEKDELMKIFEKRAGELDNLSIYNKLQKAISGENKLFTAKEVEEMIIGLAVKLSVPQEQFANLQKNVDLERRFATFNIGQLIKEADDLTYVVMNVLAQNTTEKTLIQMRRDIVTAVKMVSLDSLKSDSDYFAARKAELSLENWYSFLESEAKKFNKDFQ